MWIKGNFIIGCVYRCSKLKHIIFMKENFYIRQRDISLSIKIRIECIGGENMTEKNELVFLEPSEIPRLTKGSFGRDWFTLFDKIPKDKVLEMKKEDFGSPENIRSQVVKYNEAKGKKVLKFTQRTNKETEEKTAYVMRL